MRILLIGLALCLMPLSANAQDRRVALVVGVSEYDAVADLTNPALDAQRIHDALTAARFTLPAPLISPTKSQLDAALIEFSARAERADVAVLYFAGHGMQQFNDNWLIPRDARLSRPVNIRAEGVRLQDIVSYLSGAALRIIILDACRDNPFSARWPSTMAPSDGLTRIEDEAVPAGTVIAYSAGPRQKAPDNGAYARALATRMLEEGVELRTMFDRVRADTARGAELTPEETVALNIAPFYFVGGRRDSDAAEEFAAFDAAARGWTLAGWRAFLERWPRSAYSTVAQNAIASLERGGAAPEGVDPVEAAQRALDAVTPEQWSAAEPSQIVTQVISESSREGIERLSGSGDPRAQLVVGAGYRWGLGGFPDNDRRAAVLFRSAALAEVALAQAYLGGMYYYGDGGLPLDEAEAVRLYRLAADQGNGEGQVNLGFAHHEGRGGLAEDKTEALRLYRLAAEQGNALGQANLGSYYDLGLGGLEENDAEAVRLYRLAAEQGNALGQVNLGDMYEHGEGGLEADDVEAVRLYRLAADQGYPRGRFNLARMYEQGRGGLAQDSVEAVRLYRLAANQGNVWAQDQLRRLGETW